MAFHIGQHVEVGDRKDLDGNLAKGVVVAVGADDKIPSIGDIEKGGKVVDCVSVAIPYHDVILYPAPVADVILRKIR